MFAEFLIVRETQAPQIIQAIGAPLPAAHDVIDYGSSITAAWNGAPELGAPQGGFAQRLPRLGVIERMNLFHDAPMRGTTVDWIHQE